MSNTIGCFDQSQKEYKMTNGNISGIQTLVELAKENVVNSTPDATETNGPVCQPGDTECVNRWVQAFSDCE